MSRFDCVCVCQCTQQGEGLGFVADCQAEAGGGSGGECPAAQAAYGPTAKQLSSGCQAAATNAMAVSPVPYYIH